MRTDDFQNPSRMSTLLFGAVILLLFFCLAAGFLTTWLPQTPNNDDFARGHEKRKSLIFWGGLASGVFAAGLATWLWRSPPRARFHATFLSGLALLLVTFAYVCHIRSYLFSVADVLPPGIAYGYFSVPLVTLYSTSLALILIVSSICCDRP